MQPVQGIQPKNNNNGKAQMFVIFLASMWKWKTECVFEIILHSPIENVLDCTTLCSERHPPITPGLLLSQFVPTGHCTLGLWSMYHCHAKAQFFLQAGFAVFCNSLISSLFWGCRDRVVYHFISDYFLLMVQQEAYFCAMRHPSGTK